MIVNLLVVLDRADEFEPTRHVVDRIGRNRHTTTEVLRSPYISSHTLCRNPSTSNLSASAWLLHIDIGQTRRADLSVLALLCDNTAAIR